jgi:hypothetical protein
VQKKVDGEIAPTLERSHYTKQLDHLTGSPALRTQRFGSCEPTVHRGVSKVREDRQYIVEPEDGDNRQRPRG